MAQAGTPREVPRAPPWRPPASSARTGFQQSAKPARGESSLPPSKFDYRCLSERAAPRERTLLGSIKKGAHSFPFESAPHRAHSSSPKQIVHLVEESEPANEPPRKASCLIRLAKPAEPLSSERVPASSSTASSSAVGQVDGDVDCFDRLAKLFMKAVEDKTEALRSSIETAIATRLDGVVQELAEKVKVITASYRQFQLGC